MKLDCAEFYSKEPTEEMIVDLVRNNAKCEHAPLHWSVSGNKQEE